MIWAEAYAIHRARSKRNPSASARTCAGGSRSARQVTGADYAECRQRAREWRRLLEGVFEQIDLSSPAAERSGRRAAECETIETTRRLTRLTYAWSLAGLPALAVPCGFADGLPVGLQLAAAPFGEATLLRAGAAYQRETDWHLRVPPLAQWKEEGDGAGRPGRARAEA